MSAVPCPDATEKAILARSIICYNCFSKQLTERKAS